jgi:hypothetical protein
MQIFDREKRCSDGAVGDFSGCAGDGLIHFLARTPQEMAQELRT